MNTLTEQNAFFLNAPTQIVVCSSDEKSQLTVPTIEAVISIKVNVKQDCCEYYKTLKSNTQLLKKIYSSEKYNN